MVRLSVCLSVCLFVFELMQRHLHLLALGHLTWIHRNAGHCRCYEGNAGASCCNQKDVRTIAFCEAILSLSLSLSLSSCLLSLLPHAEEKAWPPVTFWLFLDLFVFLLLSISLSFSLSFSSYSCSRKGLATCYPVLVSKCSLCLSLCLFPSFLLFLLTHAQEKA